MTDDEQAVRISRIYSCGCIMCICPGDECCYGCGAKSCGKSDAECVVKQNLFESKGYRPLLSAKEPALGVPTSDTHKYKRREES